MSGQLKKNGIWESYKPMILLLMGIVAGSIIGLIYGERAIVLKPFGQIFLNLMFTAVVPLVFFSLASSIAKMSNMQRLGKILRNVLGIFCITGMFAAIIIIIIVRIYPPAQGVVMDFGEYVQPEKANLLDQLVKALTVGDFNLILSKNAMLPLIIFAMTFGYCVSSVNKARGVTTSALVDVLDMCSEVFMKMISIIMLYAPIGLGAYFAALIGQFGADLLGAYARAILMFYPI